MTSRPVSLLATVLCASLAGCASVSDVRQLRYGSSAAEVVQRLGKPDQREIAGTEETWSYWVSGANCQLTLRRGRLLAVPRCRTEEERDESQAKAEMRASWLSWKEAQAEEQYTWSAWKQGRAIRAEQAERASAAAARRKPLGSDSPARASAEKDSTSQFFNSGGAEAGRMAAQAGADAANAAAQAAQAAQMSMPPPMTGP